MSASKANKSSKSSKAVPPTPKLRDMPQPAIQKRSRELGPITRKKIALQLLREDNQGAIEKAKIGSKSRSVPSFTPKIRKSTVSQNKLSMDACTPLIALNQRRDGPSTPPASTPLFADVIGPDVAPDQIRDAGYIDKMRRAVRRATKAEKARGGAV